MRVRSHGDVSTPVPPRPRPLDTLAVSVRTRRGDGAGSDEPATGQTGQISDERRETWRAAETAVLVVDMWAEHECVGAALRLHSLVPRLDAFLVPTPNTLHPPYTQHPTPYTLHPTPYTLHPAPQPLPNPRGHPGFWDLG